MLRPGGGSGGKSDCLSNELALATEDVGRLNPGGGARPGGRDKPGGSPRVLVDGDRPGGGLKTSGDCVRPGGDARPGGDVILVPKDAEDEVSIPGSRLGTLGPIGVDAPLLVGVDDVEPVVVVARDDEP